MVEALVGVMREHPSLPALFQSVDKERSANFTRAMNDALELLTGGGLGLDQAHWTASYLLQALDRPGRRASPAAPTLMTPEQAAEWRRQKRLTLEKLPPDEYGMLVAFARTLEREPDIEQYYRFGVDLLMAAVETAAARAAKPADPPTTHRATPSGR